MDGNFSESDEDVVFVEEIDGDIDGRQSWLREARSICGDDLEGLASEAASGFPTTSPRDSIEQDQERSVLFTDPLPNDNDLCDGADEENTELTEALCEIDTSSPGDASEPIDLNAIESELREKYIVDEKMSKIIDKTVEEDDYVFQASVAMSDAIEQEELQNYEAAFEMYKFGIGLLLRGVQTDTNMERREAVRRKSAQYLLRAEQLYKGSLRSMVTPDVDNSLTLGDNKWRFRLSDVKVFGVIDKVMLVEKVYTSDVFIMKVLHKQGAEYKKTVQSNKKKMKQPRNLYNCQYMVKLMNCVETQTGVYLLLEYVPGGRLWDFLNIPLFTSALQRKQSCAESHHSWNTTDCNSSFVDKSNDYTDIIDIPCNSYVRQGSSELSKQQPNTTLSKCKIKRSSSQNVGLTEDYLRTWCAQIALALMDLHSKNIICRDLNPRNVLLDSQGNVKLTYFSNVDGIDYTLDTEAVNLLYTSPEVDGVFEPTKSTDWWSYGALVFELLTGDSLSNCHLDGINSRSIITLPRKVSNEACSLLAGLLRFNPKERLGTGPNGTEEIKSHPFFNGINWNKLRTCKS